MSSQNYHVYPVITELAARLYAQSLSPSLVAPATVVLTPNLRLANYLLCQLDQYQRDYLGHNFWERPSILAFSQWLITLWGNVDNSTILLSDFQEYVLWEKIIRRNKYEHGGKDDNSEQSDKSENVDLIYSDSNVEAISALTQASLPQLINNAIDAWRLLRHWQVSPTELSRYDASMAYVSDYINQPTFTTEAQYFAKWADKFSFLLKKHGWCTPSDLPQLLSEFLATSSTSSRARLQLPTHIMLIGFEKLTLSPQEKELLNVLQRTGCDVEYLDPQNLQTMQNTQATQTARDRQAVQKTVMVNKAIVARGISFADTNAEIYAMAHWARLMQETSCSNDYCSIGCIVPNLHAQRTTIERVFTEVFTPADFPHSTSTSPYHAAQINSVSGSTSFNISAGIALSQYPLIDSAITLLSLGKDELPLGVWRNILTMPFSGDNWQNPSRGALALEKLTAIAASSSACTLPRNSLPIHVALPVLRRFHPEFAHAINEYRQTLACIVNDNGINGLNAKHWAQFFSEQLQVLGWPGKRGLNSDEYQTIERWHELLGHDFALLDVITPQSMALTYGVALQKLKVLAQRIIFQPHQQAQQQLPQLETKHPVNILGVLEAAGMTFDYLWIMGMDDQSWPVPPSPNPLLPLSLQKKLNMPNSSSARELEFCRAITARWRNSATRAIVYSFAKQRGEQELSLSPLLQSYVSVIAASEIGSDVESEPPQWQIQQQWQFERWQSLKQARQTQAESIVDTMEAYADDTAPLVSSVEDISHGTGVLQAQAQCPFQAFAKYRLHAIEPTADSAKLWRGNVLHYALEYLWQKIVDHAALVSYLQQHRSNVNGDSWLAKTIATAIECGIEKATKHKHGHRHGHEHKNKHEREHQQKHSLNDADDVDDVDDVDSDGSEDNVNDHGDTGFLALEKACLARILWRWLQLESEREPFAVVATEKEVALHLGGLPLNLRVDRVDQLEDGSLVVIDYKTGKASPRIEDCLRIPPTAPQLPLYCVALQQEQRDQLKASDWQEEVQNRQVTSSDSSDDAGNADSAAGNASIDSVVGGADGAASNIAITTKNMKIAALVFAHVNLVALGDLEQQAGGRNTNTHTSNESQFSWYSSNKPFYGVRQATTGEAVATQTTTDAIFTAKNSLASWKGIDFAAQSTTWEANLTMLAEDFMRGVACVAPYDKFKACSYCNLQALCRVTEQTE